MRLFFLVLFLITTIASSYHHTSGQLIDREPHLGGNGANLWNQLQDCKAQLEVCLENEAHPTYLFIQTAYQCSLSVTEEGKYVLSSSDLSDETWAFSDRPFQLAETIPTTTFLDEFDTMFHMTDDDTGVGRPNAAFTFILEDDDKERVFKGPLIAVMIDAAHAVVFDEEEISMTKSSLIMVEYELIQSDDQESIMPLEMLVLEGEQVEFTSCSIFIDGRLCRW